MVGLERGAALNNLEAAFLNVSVKEIGSLEPAGIVVHQSRAPGSSVPQGTFVTVFVSNGETPVGKLPTLGNLTVEEALEVLNEFQLETGVNVTLVTQNVVTSNPNLIGKIISTSPAASAEVSGSITVTATVGVSG